MIAIRLRSSWVVPNLWKCADATAAYNPGKVAPAGYSNKLSEAVANVSVTKVVDTSVMHSTPLIATTSWTPDAIAKIPWRKATPLLAQAPSNLAAGFGVKPTKSAICGPKCPWWLNKSEE